MSKANRRTANTPPVRPKGYRQTMHLGLAARDLENLDRIAAAMRRDPILGGLQANIGREKAARYAIAYCVAHLTTG